MIRKNLHRIVQEIRETQELYNLLMKSSHTALSAEEKAKVRQQLLDILKTIPTLAIFALPGGGLILPVLIRLLPFNLLPSSFEEE
jgi:ABC-type proline/glycine betaine transport system permease subunit